MTAACGKMAAMRVLRSALILIPAAMMLTVSLRADDGAASIAAGGIIVMKRETRIVMAKEVLSISARRVMVDYDFRNDSDEDVTTEVAFPIPAYSLGQDERAPKEYGFDDFKLWVDGKPLKFSIETRALLGKRDISEVLARLHVDAASFGHYDYDPPADGRPDDLDRLSPAQRGLLHRMKAATADPGSQALWQVQKRYHWTQTFPAHAIVHIRHEYTPVLGSSNTVNGPFLETGKTEKGSDEEELPTVCPAPELLRALRKETQRQGHIVDIVYVDFILTTANTWKQPIEDFTLLVERPPIEQGPAHNRTATNYVSFCWNGPVTKVDADHFSAHTANFVPAKELRVGFLQGYLMDDGLNLAPQTK
jgi:hypothetical protein